MPALICEDQWDVARRLQNLGLDENCVKEAIRAGYLAYAGCTANHPPLIPALMAWGETVKTLRDQLAPRGWTRSDENNYSLVVDPRGQIAIAVATGNEATGRSDQSPSTKCRKGPSTLGVVLANSQMDFDFMEPAGRSQPAAGSATVPADCVTWILLIHRTSDEVRCELSLPTSMGLDGHIDGWYERILLGAMPLDEDRVDVAPPPPPPHIEVNVIRRA